MSSPAASVPAGVIVLSPGEGRHDPCGPMQSVFLADGAETGDRYSLSIWCADAEAGTFLRIPVGVMHDFENRTARRAGALNVLIPAGFEANMPSIVEWFRLHPEGH